MDPAEGAASTAGRPQVTERIQRRDAQQGRGVRDENLRVMPMRSGDPGRGPGFAVPAGPCFRGTKRRPYAQARQGGRSGPPGAGEAPRGVMRRTTGCRGNTSEGDALNPPGAEGAPRRGMPRPPLGAGVPALRRRRRGEEHRRGQGAIGPEEEPGARPTLHPAPSDPPGERAATADSRKRRSTLGLMWPSWSLRRGAPARSTRTREWTQAR